VDWISRLEAYSVQVEERITAITAMIMGQKETIARLRAAGRNSLEAEKALATYHEEGLWLYAQRERVKQQILQVRQQQQDAKDQSS